MVAESPIIANNTPEQQQCMAITRSQTQHGTAQTREINQHQNHTPTAKDDKPQASNEHNASSENEPDEENTNESIEILTDANEIATILRDYHDNPLGGHQGIFKTYNRIIKKYKWNGMSKDIKNYIKKCPKCQKIKIGKPVKAPMVITDTAKRPFQKVYLDIVGPLTESYRGNRYILTFIDDLSRFMECIAIPDMEAETVAKAFFEHIVCYFGPPSKLITDQGSNFVSELFKRCCKMMKIEKIQTTAYHPQSNGTLERAHRPLTDYLRTFVDQNPQTWDEFLKPAMFVHSSTVHSVTKLSPMDCLFGFTPNLPDNLKRKVEPVYEQTSYYNILKYKLQKAYEVASQNSRKHKETSKQHYDKNCLPTTFHVGDLVLLRNPAKKHKLEHTWQGPYQIIAVPNEVNSVIKIKTKKRRVHNNRLKLFNI